MNIIIHLIVLLSLNILTVNAFTQSDTAFNETNITLQTKTGVIFGTLTIPKKLGKIPVALIIAGSGPTDRDGNNSRSA